MTRSCIRECLKGSVRQDVLPRVSKHLASCSLHKGIAARDQIPNGLATEGCRPELAGAHSDVQGGCDFAGRKLSIRIVADRLGTRDRYPNCVSDIVVCYLIGDQRISFKVQYFAATITDLVRAPSVREA